MELYTYLIDQQIWIGTRLDVFLADEIDYITRSRIQKLIKDGQVTVNKVCCKANYLLKQNDIVTVNVPLPVEMKIEGENIPLNILHEDDDVIVVNKSKGMVVHPAAGHSFGTLVNALMFHCKGNLSGINGQMRPGIVHRIDKDTSGVLVVAKNDIAHQSLSMQLATHSMTRVYYAIVHDGIKQDLGTIDRPVGRHISDRKKMCITDRNSRRAVTHFRVIERMGRYTFVEARLETGRTHQIRAHMAHIGHPLVGDTVYGRKNSHIKPEGQVLHAKILGFLHPTTRKYLEFDAELPLYFNQLLDVFRNS